MTKQWLKLPNLDTLRLRMTSEISWLAALQSGMLLVFTVETHYHRVGGRATLPFAIEESFMLEIFFVIGFFLVLVSTDISVLVALVAGSLMMLFAGLFVTAVKLLPWLLLAVAAAWVWRALTKPAPPRSRFDSRLR